MVPSAPCPLHFPSLPRSPPATLYCLQERVRRQFNAALDMMNTAVDGAVPPLAPQGAYASRWATQEEEAVPEAQRGEWGGE